MTTYYVTDETTGETVTVSEDALPETVALFKERLRKSCLQYFPIVKIEQNGSDTTWITVSDLSGADDGIYAAFNFFTGMHEPEGTAAEALAKRAELVEQYVNDAYGSPNTQVNSFPNKVEVLP